MPRHGDYKEVIVETFNPTSTSGLHGAVHVRPAPDQPFPQTMLVECSHRLITDYPVGTRFRIRAKITDEEGGRPFLYSYHGWPFESV